MHNSVSFVEAENTCEIDRKRWDGFEKNDHIPKHWQDDRSNFHHLYWNLTSFSAINVLGEEAVKSLLKKNSVISNVADLFA